MKIRLLLPALMAASILVPGCAGHQPSAPTPIQAAAQTPAAQQAPGITFLFPVAEGRLPLEPELMPGAPRDYRGGVHQGVDIYYKSGTSMVPCKEPVLNAAEGWVTRADTDWKAMNPKEYDSITQRLKKEYDEALLDRLRGRQVWVRTAEGVTIRYCHLDSVAAGITAGIRVNPGVVIGAVGNSGTADGSKLTARNCHLHLEIWMPDGKFLGDGLPARDTRDRWNNLFGLHPAVK